MRLALNGACGRMGVEVVNLAAGDDGIDLVALWERARHSQLGQDPFSLGLPVRRTGEGQSVDVVVDFSSESGLLEMLATLPEDGTALVSGTTGLTEDAMEQLAHLATRAPVFHAANMSTGIHVLHQLAGLAATLVGGDWDVELVEMHHNRKVDAPSGTAISLARTVRSAWPMNLQPVYGRWGVGGPRKSGEMGILALRAGDVVGEHELIFGGPAETLRLKHRAVSRSVFAVGAIRAARWIVKQEPGLYSMEHMLPPPTTDGN